MTTTKTGKNSNLSTAFQSVQDKISWKGLALAGTALAAGVTLLYRSRARDHDSVPMLKKTDENWHFFWGHAQWAIEGYKNGNLHDKLEELLTKGDVRVACMGKPFGMPNAIYMMDPQLIKWVFTDEFEQFQKGDPIRYRWADLLGDGIFLSDPPAWRLHRKVASKMFSMRNLKFYMFECAVSAAKRTMKKIDELSDDVMDINNILGRFTLDSFIEICFGKSIQVIESAPKPHPFSEAFDALVARLSRRGYETMWPLMKRLRMGSEANTMKDLDTVDKFVYDLLDLKSRKKLIDESGKSKHDIVSLYLAADPSLTRERLRNISLNMIIAGRDTTRTLLSWFLYVIYEHPQIKEKVLEEIHGIGKEELTYEDANDKLKYLEAALLETLRMYPPVPYIARRAKKDTVLPGGEGYVVHKDDAMLVHMWSLCRSDKVWKDPLKFDPMRFYEKGVNSYPPHIFPQFNLNPRVCLGRQFALLEAKSFCFYFFKTFTYQRTTQGMIWYDSGALLNMTHGFPIRVSPV